MSSNDESHILSYGKLIAVFIALIALTFVTVMAARVDLGAANIWIALLIASTKASLVVLFFMHMKFEGAVIRYSFITTLVSLAIIISFIFWDVAFR